MRQTLKTPLGPLLTELGYLEESDAAVALSLNPATLIAYRKAGRGPDYAVVGRAILYSPGNLQKWLEAGGTRAFEALGADTPAAKRITVAKPRAKAPHTVEKP
jgi:hypothetical protein